MAWLHRSIPVQDITSHQWFTTIQESQPNSISANALRFPEFLDSTSTWNQRHIISFRVLDFNDLPLSYIYPTEFYPQTHDVVISQADRLFSISKDDVRKGAFDMFLQQLLGWSDQRILERDPLKWVCILRAVFQGSFDYPKLLKEFHITNNYAVSKGVAHPTAHLDNIALTTIEVPHLEGLEVGPHRRILR
jgi:hypothetical protein